MLSWSWASPWGSRFQLGTRENAASFSARKGSVGRPLPRRQCVEALQCAGKHLSELKYSSFEPVSFY